MIKLPFAKNKTYYVVGLGKSNRAVVKSLQKSDADVRVWDDNADNLTGFDPKIVCPIDKAPWSKIKAVVAAPGLKPSHPVIAMATTKNTPVICDIDLFAQTEPTSKIIGVTGTNGKSTTTALIHHVLNFNDKSQMGGNIGKPVMDLKSKVDYTVLELSSYQLSRAPSMKCDVACLLNISPDHLDWHGDMNDYIASKSTIFDQADVKIIGIDDEYSKSIFESQDNARSVSIYDENLPFNPSDFPRMKGAHNLQNLLMAYETCRALDIDHDIVIDRMKSFEGLSHRQYLARVINGVPYINDSKATNAEATKHALRAFKNIILIAGGVPKDGGLNGLDDDLKSTNMAVVYGEAKDDFAKYLNARGIKTQIVNDLSEAVQLGHKQAQDMRGEPSGTPTVLLSPACASFDQYPNFEARGDHFIELVNALSDE